MDFKFYIETSAVNFFLNIMRGVDAQATREYQLSKGRHWYISTAVLWEIMQIRDFKDYDAVLFLATFLFEPHLLKSAPEIVLDYFEKGCPLHHALENPFTESTIGASWEHACADRSYSFNIHGSPFLEVTTRYKEISKQLPYLCSSSPTSSSARPEFIEELRSAVDEIYRSYNSDTVTEHIKSLRRMVILLLLMQVCYCIDLAGDAIAKYWQTKGIDSPLDRFDFMATEQPDILHRGPLWNMANTVLFQTHQKKVSSRGAIHDGLHAIYLPFVDIFLTNDDHFSELRDVAYKEYHDALYRKVYHLKEMRIVETPWQVEMPEFRDGVSGAP